MIDDRGGLTHDQYMTLFNTMFEMTKKLNADLFATGALPTGVLTSDQLVVVFALCAHRTPEGTPLEMMAQAYHSVLDAAVYLAKRSGHDCEQNATTTAFATCGMHFLDFKTEVRAASNEEPS